MAKISVIVPVHDTEKYLSRCINSILAQTYSDFELILIDNGSTDSSGKICDGYAEADDRVVVIHQEDRGASGARNSGLDWAFENSDCEWVSFVDSDDWVHPQYLELLYNSAVKYEISVCAYQTTTDSDIAYSNIHPEPQLVHSEDLYSNDITNFIVAWGKLYKKECFKSIRFPEGKLHEDEFVTYKILFCYETLPIIKDALYYYYQNTESFMHSEWDPARLVKLDALNAQIDLLKEKGYDHAQTMAIRRYAYTLWEFINRSSKSTNRKPYDSVLKKMLRRYLKDNKNVLGFRNNDNMFFYEAAYPLEMKVYWILIAIKHKVFRK